MNQRFESVRTWGIAVVSSLAIFASGWMMIKTVSKPRIVEVGIPQAAEDRQETAPKMLPDEPADDFSRMETTGANEEKQRVQEDDPDELGTPIEVRAYAPAQKNATDVACEAGNSQSPINIEQPLATRELRPLLFKYGQPALVAIEGRGKARKLNLAKAKYSLRFQSRDFVLSSLSVKFPSEHMVDGEQYSAEFQLHHKATDGDERLMVALMLRGGSSSEWSENFLLAVQNRSEFNFADLIPDDKSYYQYLGSLTEPPCDEGVTWIVLKKPLFASDEVLQHLREELGSTARPLQATHQRRPKMSSR